QIIGDDFVEQNEAAVLKVPSSIVHEEFNYLINPNHRDAKRIIVRSTSPMVFDSRFGVQR
ncbi:MAG: RES family NAD+ phosphorylase, partial [Saprospiraceae bacterium]